MRKRDTAAVFDWLIAALSYQGISDQIAYDYMEQHGYVRWDDINQKLAQGCQLPQAQELLAFPRLPTTPSSGGPAPSPITSAAVRCRPMTCATAASTRPPIALYLFIRDIADGDLIGWIDQRLQAANSPAGPDRVARMRDAVIAPLREISRRLRQGADHGLVVPPARSAKQAAAVARGRGQHDRHRHPRSQLSAPHRHSCTGSAPPTPMARPATGQAAALRSLKPWPNGSTPAPSIPAFPAVFPRFVQHAIWRYCAQSGLDVCNGNRIDDRKSCDNVYCQIHNICDRIALYNDKYN